MLRKHSAWCLGIAIAMAGCGDGDRADDSAGRTATRQSDREASALRMPKTLALDLGKGVTIELTLIPAGKFLMGSPETESGRVADEGPRHAVTIGRPYYIGVTEVTQAQWRAVMNTEPWKPLGLTKAGDDNAASYVNWSDATAFCRELSKKAGKSVRLPTEAEWEYACRAGAATAYCFGDDVSKLDEHAWHRKNAYLRDEKYAHPVGRKQPNAFGLRDMHGNVYEWCSDWYADSYAGSPALDPKGPSAGSQRVIRGGSWVVMPEACRSASRVGIDPAGRASDAGFRVVVSLADLE